MVTEAIHSDHKASWRHVRGGAKAAKDGHSGSAFEPQSIIETGKRRWQKQPKMATEAVYLTHKES